MRKAENLPLYCAVVTKSGNLNFLRTLWACPGLLWDCFTFTFRAIFNVDCGEFNVDYRDINVDCGDI